MPRVVRREGVGLLRSRMAARHRGRWGAHPTLMPLYADHFPQHVERLVSCRSQLSAYRDEADHRRFTVRGRSCRLTPYCIVCTGNRDWGQSGDWLRRFQACTPSGKPLRAFHVVVTAPTDKGGEAWGWKAREDVPRFRSVVAKFLKYAFGKDVGGVMAYQDFGEDPGPFVKPHPHMDCVVNGYGWNGSQVRLVKRPYLVSGGYGRHMDYLARLALTFRLDARPGNLKVLGPYANARYVRAKLLGYALREMQDFRDYEYDRARQTVAFRPYRTQRRVRRPVSWFLDWFGDYQRRFWPQDVTQGAKRLELSAGFGYMAKAKVRAAGRAIGGLVPSHRRGCACSECVDWRRVVLVDGQEPVPA